RKELETDRSTKSLSCRPLLSFLFSEPMRKSKSDESAGSNVVAITGWIQVVLGQVLLRHDRRGDPNIRRASPPLWRSRSRRLTRNGSVHRGQRAFYRSRV